jgi:hypothetical protein
LHAVLLVPDDEARVSGRPTITISASSEKL